MYYQPGVAVQDPVIIQINAAGSSTNYYVGFNHAIDYNGKTQEAPNLITIQQYTGTGYGYSYLVAELGEGEVWTEELNGVTARMRVLSIDPAKGGGARVNVTYG